MKERFDNFILTRPRLKKVTGWFLVVIGFFALVTPLTPGGVLFFVGLEILGLRVVFSEKIQRFRFKRKDASVNVFTDVHNEKQII